MCRDLLHANGKTTILIDHVRGYLFTGSVLNTFMCYLLTLKPAMLKTDILKLLGIYRACFFLVNNKQTKKLKGVWTLFSSTAYQDALLLLSDAVIVWLWMIALACLTFSRAPLQTIALRRLNISPGEANRGGPRGVCSEALLLWIFWQKSNIMHNMYAQHDTVMQNILKLPQHP